MIVRVLSTGLFLAAAGWLVAATVSMTLSVGDAPWPAVLAAAAAYLGSHLVRAVRLAVVLNDRTLSLRRVLLVHLYTSGVSWVLPFKLGEAYRVYELGRVVRHWPTAVFTIWIERLFDAVAVAGLLAVAAASGGLPPEAGRLAAALAGFFAATFVAFVLLPENLPAVKRFVVQRYAAGWSVTVLRAVAWLQDAVRLAPRLISRRWASLLVLTAGIWGLELVAYAALIPAAADGPAPAAVALLGRALSTRPPATAAGPEAAALAATAGPLLVLAVAAMVCYLPSRVRPHG